MAQLTHAQYEILERALSRGSRIVVMRRGRQEYVIIPLELRTENGREVIEARNPTTGHGLTIHLDEIDGIEAAS
jgi:hypothetical protein